MKKNENLFVMVFVMVVLMVMTSACKNSSDEPVPVDDIFSVPSITHMEIAENKACYVNVNMAVDYTNNSNSEKTYTVTIEWGDGKVDNVNGSLSPTTTLKTTWMSKSHTYKLKQGEKGTKNVKFTVTHQDPKIQPIVRIVPILVRAN